MAQLVFIDGRNMGNALPLPPVTSIGSGKDSMVSLADPGVLPHHATIRLQDGVFRIARSDPAARLSVNGSEVTEHPLRHGDIVSIAAVALLFSDEPALRRDPGPDDSRIVSRTRVLVDASVVRTNLERLYEVGTALNASLQLSGFADRLLSHLLSAFRPDRCFLLVADPQGELQVRAERGAAPGRPSRAILSAAVESLESVLAQDGPRSTLCAPLFHGERLLGAILLTSARYGEADLNLFNAVASHAASALQNVLSLEREVAHRRALQRLGESSQRLSSYLSRESILAEAIAQACAIFECSKASLMLLDAKGEHLEVAESNCIDRSLWPSARLRPGEGFAGRAFQEAKPLLVTDARGPRPYETSSFAIAPVVSRGEGLKSAPSVVGVLSVTDKTSKGSFSPEDLELLVVFAAEVGIALTNAELFERATLDGLTRVWTRQYLDFRLEDLVRSQEPVAILMADLDHFKDKNDVYGHPVGDAVLFETAGLLKLQVRRSDGLVARYGGEEFVAILPGLPADEARGVAEDVRRAIEDHPFNAQEEPIRCTVSIGVAALRPGETPAALLKRADAALYAAKRNGRNRVEISR